MPLCKLGLINRQLCIQPSLQDDRERLEPEEAPFEGSDLSDDMDQSMDNEPLDFPAAAVVRQVRKVHNIR